MSLLLDILQERWMIAESRQSSYFPIVMGMIEAAGNGLAFPPIHDKGNLIFSSYLEDSEIRFEIDGSELPIERKNFATGAERVREQLPNAPEGSIAVIPVKGEFLRYGTMCAWGADEITPVIKLAAAAKNISAIVLDIDSGGGAERAVPPFLQAIEFAQKTQNKPVVAHGDLCASAAYYVASHCDYVLANNKISSAFGSIGVMVSWPDFREYYAKQGVSIKDIYAPQSKQKNASYRALLEGNEDVLKAELAQSANTFISNVKKARSQKFSDLESIWEGAVFQGNDLKKHGLVDGYGDLMKAIEIASALAEARQL